jgi:general secretion pathway protein A
MYLKTFGLQEKPFHITPNPRFVFLSKNHKEAFAHLLYGIQQRVGFLSLTGEVGTGKTTVLRTLLRQLEQSEYQVALIFNPCLSELELLHSIHREFGIDYPPQETNLSLLHDSLNRFLLAQRQAGKTVVLVIDEAQNLAPNVLEQLRLLSNLETETDKLLQLVIVGQPELEEVLARRELRQLKQRLVVTYRLETMDEQDSAAYIGHRLKVAGYASTNLLTPKALNLVYRSTKGLPRLINILCDRALLVAYANEKTIVDHHIIRQAQSELNDRKRPAKRQFAHWLIVFLMTLLGGGLVYIGLYFAQTKDLDPQVSSLPTKTTPVPITRSGPFEDPESAKTATDDPDPGLMNEVIEKISTYSEKDSALLAANAVLELWQQPALKVYDAAPFNPLATAIRTRNLDTIQFQGSLEQLRNFNVPAVLTLYIPLLTGRRYLALTRFHQDQVMTVPPLTADGWLPVSVLEKIWFGKAILPWKNVDNLPYVDTPGDSHAGIELIQQKLRISGYADLPVTGVFDTPTIVAISELQKKTGLDPDGRIGAQTLLQLYRLTGVNTPSLSAESNL